MSEIREVLPGQLYRHFKGKMYQIVCVAYHSETEEKLVVYQKLYDDYRVHARPYDMFLSEVDHEKYPDVEQKYRFELIDNEKTTESVLNTGYEEVSEKSVEDDSEQSAEAEGCNSDLLNFLDAETYEEKRNLLVSMKNRMTDRLIDDLAASIDVIVDEGDLDKRYKSLLTCIDTQVKFERRFR